MARGYVSKKTYEEMRAAWAATEDKARATQKLADSLRSVIAEKDSALRAARSEIEEKRKEIESQRFSLEQDGLHIKDLQHQLSDACLLHAQMTGYIDRLREEKGDAEGPNYSWPAPTGIIARNPNDWWSNRS